MYQTSFMKGMYQSIFIVFAALIFFGCQKEVSSINSGTSAGGTVKTNIQGNIVDQDNQPLIGVNVQVSGKTATTNAKGYFRIAGVTLDKSNSVVMARETAESI